MVVHTMVVSGDVVLGGGGDVVMWPHQGWLDGEVGRWGWWLRFRGGGCGNRGGGRVVRWY